MWKLWLLAGLAACTGGAGTGENKNDDSSAQDDTGGGGGSGDNWGPSGTGYGWFVDGAEDNSVFHLEMAATRAPRDGEAYYGWVTKAGEEPKPVGEIVVTGEDLIFEAELGFNAVLEGYDSFEAWATDNGGTAAEGTRLWSGQVDPEIYSSIQNLLVASTTTPDGQGSLRSLEGYIERMQNSINDTVAATDDLSALHNEAERVVNAIEGTEHDVVGDGSVEMYDWQFSVLGNAGYISLILADISTVSAQVPPTDEIKEFGNHAYDCTELIETKVEAASRNAGTATAAGAPTTAETQLAKAVESLGFALNGEDGEDEGEDIDPITEGTLECAIFYVSEMMRMPVGTR